VFLAAEGWRHPAGKTNCRIRLRVTQQPAYGPTRNPWNTERIAGGRAAVRPLPLRQGLWLASVGTEYGRLDRIPAALLWHCRSKPSLAA